LLIRINELDRRFASFETPALRAPQDEEFVFVPSNLYLILRSAPQERVSKDADR
jgi:hypothetical protein